MITAVNNDDQPAHMEIPIPVQAAKAVNILDAEIDWTKEPEESLDLTHCKALEVKDHKLILDLPANKGVLAWVTDEI